MLAGAEAHCACEWSKLLFLPSFCSPGFLFNFCPYIILPTTAASCISICGTCRKDCNCELHKTNRDAVILECVFVMFFRLLLSHPVAPCCVWSKSTPFMSLCCCRLSGSLKVKPLQLRGTEAGAFGGNKYRCVKHHSLTPSLSIWCLEAFQQLTFTVDRALPTVVLMCCSLKKTPWRSALEF